jgi:hypothetical protein
MKIGRPNVIATRTNGFMAQLKDALISALDAVG